jgi:hypothetical protein
MRYCPKCGGEYQDWAEKCIDCGKKLVDTKPELLSQDEPENTTMVALAGFPSNLEAQFYKEILESEGVNCVITDNDMSPLGILNGASSGAVYLLIKGGDRDKAQEILSSIEEIVPEIPDMPEDEQT